MTGPDRTDHRAYVSAVAAELTALGIEAEDPRDVASHEPKRVMVIPLDNVLVWDRFDWADDAVVEWDEELGWTVDVAHEPGAVRGRAHYRRALGLGLVPDPAEVAGQVHTMFNTAGHVVDRGRVIRDAADHDPGLEAALAAYLPTPSPPV